MESPIYSIKFLGVYYTSLDTGMVGADYFTLTSEQKKLEQKVLSNDISDILEEFDSIENENYSLLAKYIVKI